MPPPCILNNQKSQHSLGLKVYKNISTKVNLNQINKITESTLTTTLSLFVEKTQLIAVSSDRLTFYKVKRVSLELKIIPAISSLAFFLQKQNKVAVNVDSVILLIWFKISLKLLISL